MRYSALQRHFFSILALAGALLAAPASADVVHLSASQDNTLYESVSGDLSNGVGSYFFAGNTDNDDLRRGLVAFDIAAGIPSGATINSVTLTLRMSRTKAGTESLSLKRLTADWGEGTSNGDGQEGGGASSTSGDATWIHTFYSTSFWSSSGGDYSGTVSDTTPVAGNGTYTWSSAQMVTDVQAWLDGTQSNYGWILIGNEGTTKTAKRFNSRENGTDPPDLEIDFTPPASTGACCATDGSCTVPGGSSECSIQGGSYEGDGTTCSPNPCPQPTGACCFADATATCSEVTEVSCTGGGGSFEGPLTTCTPNPCAVVLTPFVDALPIPPLAQPVTGSPGGTASYEMTMSEIQQQLHRDLANPTTVWGYGDGTNATAHPGPTILATSNLPVQVTWKNDLREFGTGTLRTDHYLPVDTCAHGADDQSPRTVVHLHGGHVEEADDGYPEDTFLPGAQDVYQYPNNQLTATLWYHDHALGITRLNVIMGLAGFYLVTDSAEQALGLPSGAYEIGLALQDRTFNPDGSFDYPAAWQDSFFGDTILVNGKVWPYLDVDQGKYRFRILGGSNSRHYTLSLSTGAPITVIGTEGGLLPAPVSVPEITVGPGERIDIIIDFAAYAPGTEVFLENSAPAPYPGTPGVGVIPDVMKFVVGSSAGHTSAVPSTLRTIEVLDELDAVEFREFELQKGSDPCSGFKWMINGLGWDDITEYPELETTEVWSFINRSGMTHPMHMHLVMFQILDRQNFDEVGGEIVPIGSPVPPAAEEAGWKDTVRVAPNEIVRVIARFEDYTGKFAYHCHILEHEDHEMMRQFQTVQCGNGDLEPSEECDDGNTTWGDGCSATCDLEDSFTIYGLAEGGSVSVTVDGVLVSVTTTAGQWQSVLAAAVADAINNDETLSQQGVSAVAIGNRVVTNGSIESVVITDPGLSENPLFAVPSLAPWGLAAVSALLLVVAALVLRRRAAP